MQSFLGIGGQLYVNFMHHYVSYICKNFSLEMMYISRVMPMKARGSDSYDTHTHARTRMHAHSEHIGSFHAE